ncbi:MAG: hypothetical protein EOO60_11675 [Hymenobacter sp.]|nr:MAG: hypothetical protein EOO60_11675 [Hymenobacter sp.]
MPAQLAKYYKNHDALPGDYGATRRHNAATATLPELPLAQLRWEAFERLCLRLVLTRFPIYQCEQYGVPGQSSRVLTRLPGSTTAGILPTSASSIGNWTAAS